MNVLLDAKQTAQLLTVSTSTLAKWRWAGCGPKYFKVGGKICYDLSDIRQYLQTRRRLSTSDRGPVGDERE